MPTELGAEVGGVTMVDVDPEEDITQGDRDGKGQIQAEPRRSTEWVIRAFFT